jgi:hypothetical protein
MTIQAETVGVGIDPVVASLDFSKLKWKMTRASGESIMSAAEAEFAEEEYRKFLTLKRLYPELEFVPSKLVDEFWHSHILDTRSYHADCERVFGHYLHHYPYFGIHDEKDREDLEETFGETQRIYERHFGPYPEVTLVAARCKDHACHASSECKCRVSGACK